MSGAEYLAVEQHQTRVADFAGTLSGKTMVSIVVLRFSDYCKIIRQEPLDDISWALSFELDIPQVAGAPAGMSAPSVLGQGLRCLVRYEVVPLMIWHGRQLWRAAGPQPSFYERLTATLTEEPIITYVYSLITLYFQLCRFLKWDYST